MFTKIFLEILNMSLVASIVILFVLIARLLLKKAPKIFSYVLWTIVLFRLICPFSIESVLSLLPVKADPIPLQIISPDITSDLLINDNLKVFQEVVNPIVYDTTSTETVNYFNIFTVLWMVGIISLLIYSIISLMKLKRQLKTKIHDSHNIYTCDSIQTPFVMGIIRPKIYLPASLSHSEREYILIHEQTHIRRFDHIIKIISFLVLCIHWFNPFVWVAFFLSGKDMEMSCDEAVIKVIGNDFKKEYSTSLLSLATGKRMINGTPLAFGEGNTKGRIKNVLNYKTPAFWVIILTFICVLAVSIGLITNPTSEKIIEKSLAEQLLEYKTDYVGDVSKVGNIISSLEFSEGIEYQSFELQTDNEPYDLCIKLTSNVNHFEEELENRIFTNNLEKNTHILFTLVENCDNIIFNTNFLNCTSTSFYTREQATELLGQDVGDFSESPEMLEKLIYSQIIDEKNRYVSIANYANGEIDEFYFYETEETDMIVQMIEDGNKQSQKSVNDTPTNVTEYMRIEQVSYTEENDMICYMYENDDKYYMEIPYGEIYEISKSSYDNIMDMYNNGLRYINEEAWLNRNQGDEFYINSLINYIDMPENMSDCDITGSFNNKKATITFEIDTINSDFFANENNKLPLEKHAYNIFVLSKNIEHIVYMVEDGETQYPVEFYSEQVDKALGEDYYDQTETFEGYLKVLEKIEIYIQAKSKETPPIKESPYSIQDMGNKDVAIYIMNTKDFPEFGDVNMGQGYYKKSINQFEVAFITTTGQEEHLSSVEGAGVRFNYDVETGEIIDSEFIESSGAANNTITLSDARMISIAQILLGELAKSPYTEKNNLIFDIGSANLTDRNAKTEKVRSEVTFPAYREGKTEQNADIYETVPFNVSVELPAGFEFYLPEYEERISGDGMFSTNVHIVKNYKIVGSMAFNTYQKKQGDGTEPSPEQYYQLVYSGIRLGSMAFWDVHTPAIKTTEFGETHTATFIYKDPDEIENYPGAMASVPVIEKQSILSYDKERGVYIGIQFENDILTDEEILEIANSISFAK